MNLEGYQKVQNLKEAYDLLQVEGNLILGGGAWLKLSNVKKKVGIDLEVLELNKIEVKEDGLHIGSMTTLYQLETNEELKNLYGGIISQSASKIMGVQVRNIATIGGTIYGKLGFSDLITPLLAAEASLNFYKSGSMSLESFLSTKEKVKDILVEVVLPIQKGKGFLEIFKKTSIDFSLLNVAMVAKEDTDDIVIAIGSRPAVAKCFRLSKEKVLKESYVDGRLDFHQLHEFVQPVVDGFNFGTNPRASKEYREQLAKVFVQKGLKEVLL